MNLIQDAATWLAGQLKEAGGVTVSYRRGSGSVSLTATASMHRYEVVDSEGFGIMALSRDYIVTAEDLLISSEEITPRSGDRIVETIRGTEMTFEVMAIGQLKEWEPVDTDGTMILIHTKKIN